MEAYKTLVRGYRLTTIQVIYYMPDYQDIVQEFMWQYMDIQPKFPRTHKFMNHWKENIEAVIQSVYLAHDSNSIANNMKKVNHLFEID